MKNLSQEDVEIKLIDDSLDVLVRMNKGTGSDGDADPYHLHLSLFSKISVSESSWKVTSSKLEIKLRKLEKGKRWRSLFHLPEITRSSLKTKTTSVVKRPNTSIASTATPTKKVASSVINAVTPVKITTSPPSTNPSEKTVNSSVPMPSPTALPSLAVAVDNSSAASATPIVTAKQQQPTPLNHTVDWYQSTQKVVAIIRVDNLVEEGTSVDFSSKLVTINMKFPTGQKGTKTLFLWGCISPERSSFKISKSQLVLMMSKKPRGVNWPQYEMSETSTATNELTEAVSSITENRSIFPKKSKDKDTTIQVAEHLVIPTSSNSTPIVFDSSSGTPVSSLTDKDDSSTTNINVTSLSHDILGQSTTELIAVMDDGGTLTIIDAAQFNGNYPVVTTSSESLSTPISLGPATIAVTDINGQEEQGKLEIKDLDKMLKDFEEQGKDISAALKSIYEKSPEDVKKSLSDPSTATNNGPQ